MFQTTNQIFFDVYPYTFNILDTLQHIYLRQAVAKLSPRIRWEPPDSALRSRSSGVIQVEPVLIAVNRGAIAGSWGSQALQKQGEMRFLETKSPSISTAFYSYDRYVHILDIICIHI